MAYIVHASPAGSSSPVRLRFDDLASALDQACAFLKGNTRDVSIENPEGKQLDAARIAAYCQARRPISAKDWSR